VSRLFVVVLLIGVVTWLSVHAMQFQHYVDRNHSEVMRLLESR